jgi:uncharacterized membrane protein YraQ (UPF0718 family)
MDLLDFLLTLLVYVVGTTLSAIIMGLMVNKFVIKKIMANKDIQDIVKLIRQAKDALVEATEVKKNGKSSNAVHREDSSS